MKTNDNLFCTPIFRPRYLQMVEARDRLSRRQGVERVGGIRDGCVYQADGQPSVFTLQFLSSGCV